MSGIPKPPQLRISKGTHREARHGAKESFGEDALLISVPKAPSGKGSVFVKWWKHYATKMIAVNSLTDRDIAALEQLCDAHHRLANAEKQLAEDGEYFKDDYGNIKRHPALLTVEKCAALIRSRQNDLGFSPTGRLRVPARKKVDESTGVETLSRKKAP